MTDARLRDLVVKWRQDADESSSSADAGTMCHENTVHARGLAMAFTVCADELDAVLVREGEGTPPVSESLDLQTRCEALGWNVARKTVERLDSFIAATARKRLTYERLTA